MKIAVVIVRTLMGALFIFGSVAYFADLFPKPELTGDMKTFNEGMAASGYLLNLVKATELVVGVLFLSGRFVPFAAILISPVIVNIFFVHVFLDRATLPVAIFLVLGNSFIGYYYRKTFAPLFKST